jgi:pimeloyl-ACP methyl ester carboxylesterase
VTETLPALGICLEEYEYPYPVRFLPLGVDLQPAAMAYMDIPPSAEPNGKTVVLIHGKAFGCYYFRNVIEALTGAGYRVVAPDQIGWGKSPKETLYDHEVHWTDPAVIRAYVKGYFVHPDPKVWEPLATSWYGIGRANYRQHGRRRRGRWASRSRSSSPPRRACPRRRAGSTRAAARRC